MKKCGAMVMLVCVAKAVALFVLVLGEVFLRNPLSPVRHSVGEREKGKGGYLFRLHIAMEGIKYLAHFLVGDVWF